MKETGFQYYVNLKSTIDWSQVKMLCSYKLLSHENKLLIDHLRNVATICKKRTEQANVNFTFYEKEVYVYKYIH